MTTLSLRAPGLGRATRAAPTPPRTPRARAARPNRHEREAVEAGADNIVVIEARAATKADAGLVMDAYLLRGT